MNISRAKIMVPYVISFSEIVIGHGLRNTIYKQPEIPFRPLRLVVEPLCAPFYSIVQIRMGKIAYLNNPISGTLFPPLPKDLSPEDREECERCLNKIYFDTVLPSNRIQLEVLHKGNCSWHLDCAQNPKLGNACSSVPFSAIFEGIAIGFA